MTSQISEGQRLQYNFVKPHEALDEKTPASAAGLGVKGWKELLEKAVTNQARTGVKNNQ